jgi:hypothetical protein
MDFEQAKAFRARIRAGLTTAEAVASRYVERSLDMPESTHRAPVFATEAEPPTEAEQIAALKERAETGWAPARKVRT